MNTFENHMAFIKAAEKAIGDSEDFVKFECPLCGGTAKAKKTGKLDMMYIRCKTCERIATDKEFSREEIVSFEKAATLAVGNSCNVTEFECPLCGGLSLGAIIDANNSLHAHCTDCKVWVSE